MKQKKSILAVIFSLIFSIFFLSGQLFAYKESDLKKLLDTKECPECDLSKAGYQSIHKLSTADLSGANLSDANLYAAKLSGAKLSGANLSGANLSDANLGSANLSGANLTGANLTDAHLSEANLTGANLTGANLTGAYMVTYPDQQETNLSHADLSGANLSDAKLSGANLSGADLSGANLSGANPNCFNECSVNLSGANLSGTNLRDWNLVSAKLSGANLSGANLSGANLRGADLSGANLSEANLTGANLTGADLSKANLSDILIDKKARSTNKKYLLAKLEEKERKMKAKQMLALQKKKEKEKAELLLALQKKKEKEKADRPKNELGQFYRSYAGLKKCHEVRKGYAAVHVNSVEMTNIKSKAKSIEEGIFNKYPDIKPMKDEIWKKSTRSITLDEYVKALEKGINHIEGVIEMTTELSRWQGACNAYKTIYNNSLKMYGGGGTAEKDF
jgi:uncharacterized protein YjbI with pentapeptide repeats